VLKVLCSQSHFDEVAETVFRESTTIGLRFNEQNRYELRRKSVTVTTPLGPVSVKLAYLGPEMVRVSPEYEDCRRIAEQQNVPLLDVMEMARSAALCRDDRA
jgi:uncharacterized protein (DUF111 family)